MKRALLRYHGGKHRLASWIISFFPIHRVYTEVFGGGASVLLAKPRSTIEIYNDLDGEIVNLFRVLRSPTQARALMRLVRLTPHSREEFESAYLTDGDPIEQARRTLIKSHQGFGSTGITRNTGYRIYSGGGRNGQSLAGEWASVNTIIEAVVERIQGVYIENRSAVDVLRKHDHPDTLHYVDPPYVHATRTTITDNHHAGYKHEMTDDQHRALASTLHQLKGMVVLSGYHCPLYGRLIELSHLLEERKKLPASFMLLPPKATRHEGDLVWDDIVYIRTLNAEQARRNVEQHLCPLPLDIVERALRLYSMDDDLVLDPFGGLHTVPYAAIKMNRRAYGIELHEPYWRDGVRYCQAAEREAMAPTLFDLPVAA